MMPNTLKYIVLLSLSAAGHALLPKKLRNGFLLGVSWLFYLLSMPEYLPLLIAVTAATSLIARGMEGHPQKKRAALTAALVGCFGLLFLYKYLSFAGSLLAKLPGLGTLELPRLVQPLGISFYVFCVTGYLIDVYRGAAAEKSFTNYSLMVSFFPAVLSGPIARSKDLLPQLRERTPNWMDVKRGITRFLVGMAKKMLLADVLSALVATVYADVTAFNGVQVIFTAICYALQIYCDFSSYSDMAADAIRVGDEITNFLCQISDESAVGLELMLFSMEGEQLGGITITDTQKYKTPVDINLADYVPADNQYKLVRLQGVQFSTSGTLAADSYAVTVGDASARIHPFPNTDVIGSEIPATADVVGISMSKGAVVVWPRSLGDIQAAAPSVEVAATPLFDFSETAAPINKDTEIVKYTVTYSGIKAEAPISITGANRDMITVAPAAIPAGSGTVDLIVTYHPTSTGKHSANLYFDFDGTSAELNRTISIKGCMAYDPENLPVLSLDPASLELRADVGATVTGTVTLNVANAFDYINVKRGSETATGVSINSTLFLPSLDKQTVTITFAPKAEGDVTETFTFSTMMGNPVVLTVKGFTGEPAQPEPTEGGKLELNPADAYSNYYQDFQDVVTNKPLDIPGWCNVAEEGTRAWWGYVGEDFTAAKVTAYDSSVEVGKGTPCRMLLVSPALDYLGAPYKNLSFRLMGKGLYEGMTDQLEICLIELPATRAAEPVITPMQGFNIPVTPDEDSQWIPYEVQMSAIEDMPDVFWIGFRFTSERGRDNAAQYFMTDFSWGAAPTGIGNIYDNADGRYRVYNLQGVLLLDTDDATALDRLPRGLYIVNGKKILK